MSKVDEFNRLFQEFESIVKRRAEVRDETKFKDALRKLSNNNSYVKDQYQRIEDIYALRNVFAHKNRGDYIADVKEIALKEIQDLLERVKNPPTAGQKFGCDVFSANDEDFIVSIMDTMEEKSYTHVPLYVDNDFAGVFSYTSFFSWLHHVYKQSQENPHFTKKFMSDISRKYLNSPSVNYIFIESSRDIYTVPSIFDDRTKRKQRLDCIFITENGEKNEPLQGIITSWDLGSIV